MRVFVDTSGWLAFYDRNDQYHQTATALTHALKTQRARLILSEFILAESLTLIRYRVNHAAAITFGHAVFRSRIVELVTVDESTRDRGWEIFERYADKDFSFTDCTSFALMERLGLKHAFAFDRHFEQYGFEPFRV